MYIGIDCGTQGTKAMLWDSAKCQVLSIGYAPHQLESNDSGKREQNPDDWVSAVIQAVKQALSQTTINTSAIKGISVSGQQHGLVILDQNDRVIRPAKLWCDTEPTELLAEFKTTYFAHPELVDVIGIHVPVAFTLAKLLWIKQHEPQCYQRIRKVMLPHDYLNFWLTGEYRAEYSDASGSGYFDTNQRQWSQTILDLFDAQRPFTLPELIPAQVPHGFLRATIAEQLGLPANIVVASGGGDNMMSAIGTGNVRKGLLTMSLGTSGTLFTHSSHQIDSRSLPDINAFCSSSNGWLPLVSTMNVTNVTTAFRHLLNQSLPEFEQALQHSQPGASGLCCLPYLNGARLPNLPKATATLSGITANNLTHENILRAVVEGVTFNILKGIEILAQCDLHFQQVILIGGGSNSQSWQKIISDISGLQIVTQPVSDAAAFGAAIQAQWCYLSQFSPTLTLEELCQNAVHYNTDDIVIPNDDNRTRYQDIYHHYHRKIEEYKHQYHG